MPRPDYTLSGNVPEVHGLGAGRKRWLEEPREEQWVICRVVNLATTTHHPQDEDDKRTMVLAATSMDVVRIPDDITTIHELVSRARADRPGQGTLEDAAAATGQEGTGS